MQTHSDMQNLCSIRAHSTPLSAGSAQGEYRTLGAASCSTGSPPMWSIVPDRAPLDRAICPSYTVRSNHESGAGYGVILNRVDDLASCPEPFSLFRPGLLAQSILTPPVECACAYSTDLRESLFDTTDAGRESNIFSGSISPTVSPFYNRPSAPAGPNCSKYPSVSPGGDLLERNLADSLRAVPRVISTTLALSAVSVQETEDSTSSLGSGSCVKADLLPKPQSQGRICDRSSDDTSRVPAPFDYLKNCSLKETGPLPHGNRSGEFTSEIPASGAGRNSSSACDRNSDDSFSAPVDCLKVCSVKETCPLFRGDRSGEFSSEMLASGAGRNSSRACKLCGTTKTPLWRSGPHGPKSLCNACGIRFKKSRRSLAANELPDEEISPSFTPTPNLPERSLKRKLGSAADEVRVKKVSSHPLKRSRWPALMVLKRDSRDTADDTESCLSSAATFCSSRIPQKASLCRRTTASKLTLLVKQSRCTRVYAKDEEEAAILLMALSCGLVLA